LEQSLRRVHPGLAVLGQEKVNGLANELGQWHATPFCLRPEKSQGVSGKLQLKSLGQCIHV
jgi:hypothetical protein